jgi:hypothetical protein
MADKTDETPISPEQRLCSEIQLFDLCDLDSCRFKSNRYCTNDELLARFEAISEEDDNNSLLYEDSDESVDSETDFDDFDDSYQEDDE